jgi:hypothetical protein
MSRRPRRLLPSLLRAKSRGPGVIGAVLVAGNSKAAVPPEHWVDRAHTDNREGTVERDTDRTGTAALEDSTLPGLEYRERRKEAPALVGMLMGSGPILLRE